MSRRDCQTEGHDPKTVRMPPTGAREAFEFVQCAACGLFRLEDGAWEKPLIPRASPWDRKRRGPK